MNKTPSNLELLIFNRSGACLYHADLASKTFNMTDKATVDKEKLIFGLMWGLKMFSEQLSPVPLETTFRNFSTTLYKYHIYELPTGVKFVLITTPDKLDQAETLRLLYVQYYVPFVSGNIHCAPDARIECQQWQVKSSEFLFSR